MNPSGDELMAKADALLSRGRTGSPAGESHQDYPVLTEVVDVPKNAVRPFTDAPALNAAVGAARAPSAATPLAAEIAEFEASVERRVLKAIEPAIAGVLAGTVQDRLEQATQRLAAEIASQLRQDVFELVRVEVRKAVENELAKLRDQLPKGGPR
jgi:hypothetical protein